MIIIKIKKRPPVDKKINSYHPNFNAREIAMQGLFQIEVGDHPVDEILNLRWVHSKLDQEQVSLVKDIIEGVSELEIELDELIQNYSKKDLKLLSNTIRCILRMGTYEILKEDYPANIVIDTCCTLARKYDNEKAVGFVNAVLDRIYKFLISQKSSIENGKK